MRPADTKVLRSRLHPGDAGRSVLFGMSLVQPLGACMIPIMLGALTAMLTAQRVLSWLYIGFPAALAVASAWTVFQLRRHAVELETSGEAVRIRSAWEVARGVSTPWLSVLDVQREGDWLTVTLGHDSRRFRVADWDHPSELERTLQDAADAFSGRVQDTLD